MKEIMLVMMGLILLDEIASGSSNQEFKASSEDEVIKVASNSSDSQDSNNTNDESSSDGN